MKSWKTWVILIVVAGIAAALTLGRETISVLVGGDSNPFYGLADWTPEDTTVTDVSANRDANGKSATLISAFYGLDSSFPPFTRRLICPDAPGKDGMPVIFSHELDVGTVQALSLIHI